MANINRILKYLIILLDIKKTRYVFLTAEEEELEKYIKKADDICFRLSPKEVRKLAFEYAYILNKTNIP